MRLPIILLLLSILSFPALATDDKSLQELFKKYSAVMDQQKTELIEDVFTEKFVRDSGGKKELIGKIKELPLRPKGPEPEITWKKGRKVDLYLVRMKERHPVKGKRPHEAEFIVIKEHGKLKIDGTLSDGD